MRTHDKFILDKDGNAVECADLETWGRWFETADRSVADTSVGRYRVSTVFLGSDHNFMRVGPPMLWETMVFPDPGNKEYQKRYSTKEAALKGHETAVSKVKAFIVRKVDRALAKRRVAARRDKKRLANHYFTQAEIRSGLTLKKGAQA